MAYFLYVFFKTFIFILKPRYSYSQFGEDLILRKFLPEDNGYYLDVGSGRPVKGSNTYLFYRKGWNGVTVDPIGLNSFLHKIFRPRDKFWLALCGPKNNEALSIYEFFPYEYTTMQHEIAEELIRVGSAKLIETHKISCYLPSTFIEEMVPEAPTLICIDAEGSDFSILQSIDFQLIRPRVICVESIAGGS